MKPDLKMRARWNKFIYLNIFHIQKEKEIQASICPQNYDGQLSAMLDLNSNKQNEWLSTTTAPKLKRTFVPQEEVLNIECRNKLPRKIWNSSIQCTPWLFCIPCSFGWFPCHFFLCKIKRRNACQTLSYCIYYLMKSLVSIKK